MRCKAFPTERLKIAFMITLLTGRALQWVESLWNSDSPVTHTLDAFTTHLKEVFGQANSELSVQGKSSVWNYSILFRTLAASSGWNETALITAFRRVLNSRIRQQMAIFDNMVGLETFISKAVRISQHLTACEEDLPPALPLPVPSPAPAPQPMQVSFNPLTRAERERRIHSRLCLYCGESGHILQTCPVRPPRPAVSTIQLNPQISTLTRMTIQLTSPHTSIPAQALVDFSRKLSPTEQNYDIANRELLAIKFALEEWRHWLEGAVHPFQVITHHRNLEYLRDAKRLNPRQTRWALFFTRFNFTVTYRPGAQYSRADALSRLSKPSQDSTAPEAILPPALFISPIECSLNEDIWHTTLTEPAPPGGPEGKTFVPTSIRLSLLDSLHSSLGSGHPGSDRTLSLLQRRYWWPNMARDTSQFVKGCSVCAISKTPRHLPHGKLVSLPIPRQPWSHVGVDFITDLCPLCGGSVFKGL